MEKAMKGIFATCILLGTMVAARAEDIVVYSAIYAKAGEQITFTSQQSPVLVPAVGSLIEVIDSGKTVAGTVDSVKMDVVRQTSGTVTIRTFRLNVAVR